MTVTSGWTMNNNNNTINRQIYSFFVVRISSEIILYFKRCNFDAHMERTKWSIPVVNSLIHDDSNISFFLNIIIWHLKWINIFDAAAEIPFDLRYDFTLFVIIEIKTNINKQIKTKRRNVNFGSIFYCALKGIEQIRNRLLKQKL